MSRIRLKSIPKIFFAHTFGIDAYRTKLPACAQLWEITRVAEGSLELEWNGQRMMAEKGDLVCNRHEAELCVSSPAYHCHHTVGFLMETSEEEAGELPVFPMVLRPQEGDETCRQLIDEIIFIHTLYPEDELTCAGLFLRLLGELGRLSEQGAPLTAAGAERYIRRAKQYIFEHITEDIRQKDVAEHLGISPEYLCAVFKQSEGCSMIRFVNRIKLDRVRSLMDREGFPLKEAATACGFSDPNYVSRLYKKYYGVSLTESLSGMKKEKIILP